MAWGAGGENKYAKTQNPPAANSALITLRSPKKKEQLSFKEEKISVAAAITPFLHLERNNNQTSQKVIARSLLSFFFSFSQQLQNTGPSWAEPHHGGDKALEI